MRKFEYRQIDYGHYPSEEDLNKLGEIGWELVCIKTFENELFDSVFEKFYKQKTYKAKFKREI